MENNVCNLSSKMHQIFQEIHAKSGIISYMERCFIKKVFCSCLTSPTKKFVTFVNTLKKCWIMEELTNQATILSSFKKMYKNMVADGSWVNSNNKDMKIIALTTQLKQATKKLNELEKKVLQNPSKSNGGNKKDPQVWRWRLRYSKEDHQGLCSSVVH